MMESLCQRVWKGVSKICATTACWYDKKGELKDKLKAESNNLSKTSLKYKATESDIVKDLIETFDMTEKEAKEAYDQYVNTV